MIRRIWSGMTYLRSAWILCGEMRLRWVLFVPMLLNMVLGFLLLRYGLTGAVSHRLIDALAASANPITIFIFTIIVRFVDILVVVLVTYTAVRFGAILASPLYGFIAVRICDSLLPGQAIPMRSWWGDVRAAISYELKKIGLNVCFAGIALLLPFIPVFGPFIDVGWSMSVSMIIMCLDLTDASYSRRGQTLRARAVELLGVWPEALGFALIALPLVSIPVLNLLTLPWCCAAGMYLATEAHKRAAV